MEIRKFREEPGLGQLGEKNPRPKMHESHASQQERYWTIRKSSPKNDKVVGNSGNRTKRKKNKTPPSGKRKNYGAWKKRAKGS